jgi:hypothetical protein
MPYDLGHILMSSIFTTISSKDQCIRRFSSLGSVFALKALPKLLLGRYCLVFRLCSGRLIFYARA